MDKNNKSSDDFEFPMFGDLIDQTHADSLRWFGEQHDSNVALMTLGLCGEAGEVANKIKKAMRAGDTTFQGCRGQITDELTDVLVYWLHLARLFDMDIEAAYNAKRIINEVRFNA